MKKAQQLRRIRNAQYKNIENAIHWHYEAELHQGPRPEDAILLAEQEDVLTWQVFEEWIEQNGREANLS